MPGPSRLYNLEYSSVEYTQEDDRPRAVPGPSGLHYTEERTQEAKKTLDVWTEGQTKYLLNLYAENFHKVGPLKKFKNKRAMWQYLADGVMEEFGAYFSATQVENRYKTTVRRAKKTLCFNKISGATRRSTAYDTEIEKIIGIDDSIFPEVLVTPRMISRRTSGIKIPSSPALRSSNEKSSDDPDPVPECSNIPKRRPGRQTTQEKLLEKYLKEKREMFEEKQSFKQKRHEEQMKMLSSIADAIKNVLERPEKQ